MATVLRFFDPSMSLLFTCPHCQTQTLVEDRYSGHAGRCVSCGQSIQVPFFSRSGDIQAPTSSGVKANDVLLRTALAISLGLVTVVGLVFGFFFYGLPAFQDFRQMQERVGTMRNIEKNRKRDGRLCVGPWHVPTCDHSRQHRRSDA